MKNIHSPIIGLLMMVFVAFAFGCSGEKQLIATFQANSGNNKYYININQIIRLEPLGNLPQTRVYFPASGTANGNPITYFEVDGTVKDIQKIITQTLTGKE